MLMSRRQVLLSGAGSGALALTGCVTNPTTGVWGLDPAVLDSIQKAVAAAVQYIPTVESIAATAAGLFGPTYVAIVQAGSAALNQVIAALVAAVQSLPSGAKLSLRRRLRASSPSAPVFIGVTPNGVNIVGYRV